MCYDVSASHIEAVRKNRLRMREIEREYPHDFFTNNEWKKLCEENRIHDMRIADYNKMIRSGVKF